MPSLGSPLTSAAICPGASQPNRCRPSAKLDPHLAVSGLIRSPSARTAGISRGVNGESDRGVFAHDHDPSRGGLSRGSIAPIYEELR
jgi:hypothetical protein